MIYPRFEVVTVLPWGDTMTANDGFHGFAWPTYEEALTAIKKGLSSMPCQYRIYKYTAVGRGSWDGVTYDESGAILATQEDPPHGAAQ